MYVLNRGGIPPTPHTIDIPLYARDAYIDTKHYTLDCTHPAADLKL